MNLTDNFTLEEITRSEVATRFGIKNIMPDEQLPLWIKGCIELEKVRYEIGSTAINMVGAFRSQELLATLAKLKDENGNQLYYVSKNSAHDGECVVNGAVTTACAFDVRAGKLSLVEFRVVIAEMMHEGLPVDQLITEFDSWLHIGFIWDIPPRRQIRVMRYAPSGVVCPLLETVAQEQA